MNIYYDEKPSPILNTSAQNANKNLTFAQTQREVSKLS